MNINLEKPLVFFDLETTGLNIGKDAIIEISMIKVMPSGEEITKTMLINPGFPIPEEASDVHGIYDIDVRDKPKFEEVAQEILDFIGDADLAGFNSNKFDIPLLIEEFLRCGKKMDTHNRSFIDVQNIFHKMEPRNLVAAYRFYCNKELENAHSAEADTRATYEVLKAQIERYQNTEYEDKRTGRKTIPIQNNVKKLADFTKENRNVDFAGHIIFNDRDEEVFNFGKHKGVPVKKVFTQEPQYYDWMMKADFPLYTKEIITKIMERDF
jgi:DNA polymerase-3 subunit epsilon